MKRVGYVLAAGFLSAGCLSAGSMFSGEPSGDGSIWIDAQFPADSGTDGCSDGQYICIDAVAWRCNQAGQIGEPLNCASTGMQCADGLGCVVCIPGQGKCAQGVAEICREDGSGFDTFICDSEQGMRCNPDGCEGACTPHKLVRSHAGCDFYPTITANFVDDSLFSFGVTVTNTTDHQAKVVVTRGSQLVTTKMVTPRGSESILLPWVLELKGSVGYDPDTGSEQLKSVHSRNENHAGAYRLRSDQPVVVVQFNSMSASEPAFVGKTCPNHEDRTECLSRSNDASLLLPTTSWGNHFVVMGWKAWRYQSSSTARASVGDFVSVVAQHDDTRVDIFPNSKVLGVNGQPALEPKTKNTFVLASGDVLQLVTDAKDGPAQWAGSTIQSNHPVQVISGAPCAQVPTEVESCDHLEETNLPSTMLANRYLVTTPKTPAGLTRHVLRVHGMEQQTVLLFDPPHVHKPVTVNNNEVLDLVFDHDSKASVGFVVSSTKTFGLTQYMSGYKIDPPIASKDNSILGDPNQSFVVPISRFLRRYVLTIPHGYKNNLVDVIASTGSEVVVNGTAIESQKFTAIGASGFSVTTLPVHGKGRVEIKSDKPLGLQLYGFGKYTSYRLPGGIDLREATSRK